MEEYVRQGFRSRKAFDRVERSLRILPLLPLDRRIFVGAAALRRECTSRGIAATTVDCQIAQAAIAHGCALLTADPDFERIAAVSELVLA